MFLSLNNLKAIMKKILPILLLAVSVHCIAEPINNLDCSDDEVSGYLDKSKFKRPQGFNTIPNYENEYKPTHIYKEQLENGTTGNSCSTIFDEGISSSTANDVWDKIVGVFDDPIGSMSSVGDKAMERIGKLYENTSDQLKKGICKRLSTKAVTGAIGDQMDGIYKSTTKDSVLSGTSTDFGDIFSTSNGNTTVDPSDAVGKNFTYKILRNQIGKNASTVSKLLDLNSSSAGSSVGKTGGKAVDSQLDALENTIFGR